MEIRTESLTLRTADGEMPVHLAAPVAGGPYAAVIVIMEAFGLNGHIKAVAERIAREGYVTVAPDLYHRFGSPIVAYDDIPKAIDYLKRLDDARVTAEVHACVGALTARKDVRADRIGITGFCMGGRVAFLAAAQLPDDVKAAVSFYGGGIAADQPTAPINQADRIKAPVLALGRDGWDDPARPGETCGGNDEAPGQDLRGQGLSGGRPRILLRRARLLSRRVRAGRLDEAHGLVRQAPELGGERAQAPGIALAQGPTVPLLRPWR